MERQQLPEKQRLRGFSLTTTFGDNGAFLRGLLFNYWYHQLLLGVWSYSDTVTGVTAAEKSNWVSEILFPMNIEHLKMELSFNLVEGFFGQRERISKRLSPETKFKKFLLLALWDVHNWVIWFIIFLKCLLQMQFHDLPTNPWLCKAHRGGFHINMS